MSPVIVVETIRRGGSWTDTVASALTRLTGRPKRIDNGSAFCWSFLRRSFRCHGRQTAGISRYVDRSHDERCRHDDRSEMINDLSAAVVVVVVHVVYVVVEATFSQLHSP